MKITAFIMACGLWSVSAFAQSVPPASVSVPTLGFVPDSNSGLRPMRGIAGSAFIDAPVQFGFDIVRSAIPTTHEYILASTSATEWPVLIQMKSGQAAVRSLAPLLAESDCADLIVTSAFDRRMPGCSRQQASNSGSPAITRFALSPTGTAAVFFNEANRTISTLTNLSQLPSLVARFSMVPQGTISALSVSDDGQTVFIGISDGSSGSLYKLNRNGAAALIALMSHPSAIHFLRQSDRAVIADDVDNRIYLITSGQAVMIADAQNGIASPIAVEASIDNKKIFIGNAGSGSVTTVSVDDNSFQSMDCHCTLTGLYPTHMDSVFRLNDFDNGSVVLFDASAEPRFILVPEGRF